MLHHYVFLKYKADVTSAHIDLFSQKILALKGLIPEIVSLELGIDILHDSRSWDLVLIMLFHSVDALRTYQKHPEHQAVMIFNDPFVEKIASVDFTSVLQAD